MIKLGRDARMQSVLESNAELLSYAGDNILCELLVGMVLHAEVLLDEGVGLTKLVSARDKLYIGNL